MIFSKKIGLYKRGFLYKDETLTAVLGSGKVRRPSILKQESLDIVDARALFLRYRDIETVAASGLLKENEAITLRILDNQRALVWKNDRFEKILAPGVYVLWTIFNDVNVEIVDTSDVIFEHENLDIILHSESIADFLDEFTVDDGFVGLFFNNGEFVSELKPGRYAFWKGTGKIRLHNKDTRIQASDISGQEIMTSDKVTLRINALVNYQIVDAVKSVTMSSDVAQALYREAQMALRALIGTFELEEVLADKSSISSALEGILADKVKSYGLEIVSFGIRDIILPGDMKDLMNKVTEARKVAEANQISRRDEVAATRSQINIANMLESNATLMRLRELQVIEKLAGNSNLSVILGDQGLERVFNLI